MSIWMVNNSLLEIRNNLTLIFCEMNDEKPRLLKDVVSTTYEEYKSLCNLLTQIDNEGKFSCYCLCIIVGWVESYRHNEKESFQKYLLGQQARIPQHALGKALITYQDTFYEHGLDTFGEPMYSMDNIKLVIEKHAGIIA